MENNNITHLPRALTELSSLHLLDILRNPLVKLDASVLASFGSSLEYLFIPVNRLSTLSNELHFLTVLSQLTTHGISSPKLDSTVFQGFENSLTSLDMSYAYFERIPTAVCTLKSLKSFTSNHSPNLGTYNSSIFGECNHTMTSVTSLSLQYDQLVTIPKLGRIFPRLDILRLQNNVLHFIENSSLVGMTSLTELNLGNNNLTRIPFAVNSAINLHRLHVDNNQIATVGNFDLSRLYNLTLLNLMGNPIVHISPFAFTHNALLNDIDISYTNIVQVPRALLGLKHLRNVYIDNTYSKAIECSCQAMDYLKSWNVTSIKFNHVTCSSGFSVKAYHLKSYLIADLPKCP